MDGSLLVHTPSSVAASPAAMPDSCTFSLIPRAEGSVDEALKRAAKAAAGGALLRGAFGWPGESPAGAGVRCTSGASSASTPEQCARGDRSFRDACSSPLATSREAEQSPRVPTWGARHSVKATGRHPAWCFAGAAWESKAAQRHQPRVWQSHSGQECFLPMTPPAWVLCRGVPAIPAAFHIGMDLMCLPSEVLQVMLTFLPTFRERARFCRVCKGVRCLDWRLGPPRQLDEELTGIGLCNRGVMAVAQALSAAPNAGLGELCLGSNGIGDAGACAIAEVLGAGAAIRRLSLRDNSIGDVGAVALAQALSKNTTMEELDLWGNELSDSGKEAITSMARCEVFLELDAPLSPSAPCSALNTKVRSILFEWISQVHTGMQMPMAADGVPDPQDMLFRTYRHVDAYVMRRPVQRAELQLAGVACTLLAIGRDGESQMEDDLELSSWLAFVTDGSCTVPQVRSALREVRKVLGSRLHQPTIYTFLRRFLRRTGWTEESFSLANYLIELAVIDSTFLMYRPQVVAAAAAVLSRQYLAHGINVKQVPCWKVKLLRCAHVDLLSELAPCIAALSHLHATEQNQPNKFVNRKYSWARLHSVAKIPPNTPGDVAFFAAYMQE